MQLLQVLPLIVKGKNNKIFIQRNKCCILWHLVTKERLEKVRYHCSFVFIRWYFACNLYLSLLNGSTIGSTEDVALYRRNFGMLLNFFSFTVLISGERTFVIITSIFDVLILWIEWSFIFYFTNDRPFQLNFFEHNEACFEFFHYEFV